jgi:hypothetical protein
MLTAITRGVIFEDGPFGDLLRKVDIQAQNLNISRSPSSVAIVHGYERESKLLCHKKGGVLRGLVSVSPLS